MKKTILLPLLLCTLALPGSAKTEDDTRELQSLIDKAASGDGIIRLAPKTYTLDSITVPAGLRMVCTPKTRLSVNKDALLTLRCELRAGLHPVFEGEGNVAGSPVAEKVYPQWFGAVGDGRADDGLPLRRAAEFAGTSSGRMLFIPKGRYNYSCPIRVNSNVECHGVLVAVLDLDREKPVDKWFLKWIPVKNYAMIRIIPDTPAVKLDPEYFYGIRADSLRLKNCKGIPLADSPEKKIDLETGGTLFIQSTDFFSARNVLKQDHVYEKTDICQIVSQQGDVFPEFVFSYEKNADAPEWTPEKVYARGEYVKAGGRIYKASYPSGPEVTHSSGYFGKVTLGPIDPATHANWKFKYPNGREETMMVWRPVRMTVNYTPPQPPLTITGLSIEAESRQPVTESLLVQNPGFLRSERSNVTFNNLSVVNGKYHLRLSCLSGLQNCVNNVFNNCFFSGATSQGSGYNIINGNVANITYNNCISVNARDGMAGRHAKNITISGGHYNVIDDHYGRGYIIRGVTFHCIQPWIDGFYTPKNDPQNWYFRPGNAAVAYGGGDIIIENCRVFSGNKLLTSRGDIGDFFGNIVIRNISVVTDRPFNVIEAAENKNFDYAHRVRTPAGVLVENVTVSGGGTLCFNLGYWNTQWNMLVRDCPDIGSVKDSSVSIDFFHCGFDKTGFTLSDKAMLHFRDCVFKGPISGLSPDHTGAVRDNRAMDGAVLPWEKTSGRPAR